jgi:hypothetical protein
MWLACRRLWSDAGVMVRYGLDIDFEKFMVAHGDAANLCNESAITRMASRYLRSSN